MFKQNMGQVERALRLVAGCALIVAVLMGWIGLWGWLGVVLVATAAIRSCPLYSLLGIKTCRWTGKDSK